MPCVTPLIAPLVVPLRGDMLRRSHRPILGNVDDGRLIRRQLAL